MHIALIGAGNTATVLGRMIKQAGHVITGVYGKTLTHALQLGEELNAQHCTIIENITQDAGLYVIAVPDDVIGILAEKLKLPGKVVVHTSGSVAKGALQNISGKYGVLYPLQSLRKEASHLPEVPLLIDGSDEEVKQTIKQLAKTISGRVEEASDDERLKLHLAAVMVSNFTNYLYSLTEDFCKKEHISFKALVPLIQEVAERTASYSPKAMQTGPAIRHDLLTIEKHRQLLQEYPTQKRLYEIITAGIIEFYKQGI